MNRDELEAQLRKLITGCPDDDACPYCHCSHDAQVNKAMALIDQYAGRQPTELWTAEQVAAYLGRGSTHSARAWLSRNGIKRTGDQPHPDSGRPQALYQANEVRAVCYRKAFT